MPSLKYKLFASWEEAYEAVQTIMSNMNNTTSVVPLDLQLALEELRDRLNETAHRDWLWVDDPTGVNSWITDPTPDPE